MKKERALFVVLLLLAVMFSPAKLILAQGINLSPTRDVSISQRLNEKIPLDLKFKDETGAEKNLGDFFGKRPVIIAPVYFNCPMLCTLILNGLIESLNVIDFKAGQEFDVLAVSFDSRETPELAAKKKKTYLEHYKYKGTENGWHFLTGDEMSVRKLMASIGFQYRYDAVTDQFAHASGVMMLTPEGKLSKYYYGIEYKSRDIRLGLVEASQNRIGSPVDQILLLCFHYDPATGKYGFAVMTAVRIGAAITVLLMGSFIFRMLRNDRKRKNGDLLSTH